MKNGSPINVKEEDKNIKSKDDVNTNKNKNDEKINEKNNIIADRTDVEMK